MRFDVNYRYFLRSFTAILFCSMFFSVFPAVSQKKPIAIEIGTRRAATALLTGTYPDRWTVRAGGHIPPKSLAWPIPGKPLGRGFTADNGRHKAIDITVPIGTPVKAVEQGIVGYASNGVKGYGKMVMIVHPGNFVTLYAHLDRFKVRPGQLISKKQTVALSGNTGISKGPHLHMALIVNGKPVDPMPYMKDVPVRGNIAQNFFFNKFL